MTTDSLMEAFQAGRISNAQLVRGLEEIERGGNFGDTPVVTPIVNAWNKYLVDPIVDYATDAKSVNSSVEADNAELKATYAKIAAGVMSKEAGMAKAKSIIKSADANAVEIGKNSPIGQVKQLPANVARAVSAQAQRAAGFTLSPKAKQVLIWSAVIGGVVVLFIVYKKGKRAYNYILS